MPTYEYECNDCGIRFERKQSMLDEPIKVCPECEGSVRRILFPVGIVFKGSGFYVTDNRSGSAHNGESRGHATSSDESSESKTEAKKSTESPKNESTHTESNKSEAKADAGVTS